MIDWLKLLQYSKEIIIAFAAIITGVVAIYGINSWRREHHWKIFFETSRNLLIKLYKLRDNFHSARAGFISASEFPKEYNPLNRTKNEEADAYSQIIKNRMKPLIETYQEFEISSLEAETILGKKIKEESTKIKNCIIQIQIHIPRYLNGIKSGREQEEENIIFSSSGQTDKLNIQFNEAVDGLEKIVVPYLNRKLKLRKKIK